jgi:hypothetical protein
MEQVTSLLLSYRHYQQRVNSGSDHADTDEEREDLTDLKGHANLAKDTFQAMFRGRINMDQDHYILDDTEANVLATLRSWVEEMRPSHLSSFPHLSSQVDCSKILMNLTSEQNSSQEPATWPYIRKVKCVQPFILKKTRHSMY